jgi:hypothetical protein
MKLITLENLNYFYDKIAKMISDHTDNKLNPHSLTAGQIGLGNVENTADLDKPISRLTQKALDSKQDKGDYVVTSTLLDHLTDAKNPHSVTASQLGLGNVENTKDDDKPISKLTQKALDSKQDKLTQGDGIKITYDGATSKVIISTSVTSLITEDQTLFINGDSDHLATIAAIKNYLKSICQVTDINDKSDLRLLTINYLPFDSEDELDVSASPIESNKTKLVTAKSVNNYCKRYDNNTLVIDKDNYTSIIKLDDTNSSLNLSDRYNTIFIDLPSGISYTIDSIISPKSLEGDIINIAVSDTSNITIVSNESIKLNSKTYISALYVNSEWRWNS